MIVTGLLALVVMITAACQADRAADATSGQRRHRGGRHRLRFRPPAIQVVVGTEVTWRVEDDAILHNVTGDGFASKNQASSTWAHRFDRPGRVPLHVHRARGHGRSRRGDACAGGRLRRTTGACHSPQGERNGVSGRGEMGSCDDHRQHRYPTGDHRRDVHSGPVSHGRPLRREALWGLVTVRGTFDVRDGTIVVADDPARSSVQVTLDPASFATGNKRRDRDVTGKNFLDVAAYPTMSFASAHVTPGAEGWTMRGMLTVHGVTAPVMLRLVEGKHTADGCAFTATAVVDRTVFGVNRAVGFIRRELTVTIEVAATASR
jgi:polyisoprenoid-binding protein YceI/plastocyanin